MESEKCCRIVLLDFGHPMSNSTAKNIINSLENILALRLTFSGDANQINFGILILDSQFKIFHFESNSRQNYDLIIKNLSAASKTLNGKVTVQEYKYLILSSIETAISECHGKKAGDHGLKASNLLIQFSIVTKKSASVLADILTDVLNKLQKNISNLRSVGSFKIVQILNEQKPNSCRASAKNSLIDWIFCSDNLNDLNRFFKGWLLNPKQVLRILLSRDLNLQIKCEAYDCIVNPISFTFDRQIDLFNKIQSESLNPLLDILKLVDNLEITKRLSVKELRPNFVFGIPRWIYATRSSTLSENELQVNSKIFKELCQELNRTCQGLLAKSVIPAKNKLISFHLLTSDGDMLLMNDIVPVELYFPKRIRASNFVDSSEDESAASVIKSCFQKIELLDEYNPENFSSRIYEYLKNNLVQLGQSKSLLGHFDPNVKLFKKKKTKKENVKRFLDITTFINDNENCTDNLQKNQEKKVTPSSSKKFQNIHPALLSPNVVEKYRKIPSHAFNLSELSNEYHENKTTNGSY